MPTIHPETVPAGGTTLAEAIRLSVQSFPEASPTGRVLVIVSDGEDHGGGVQDAAAKAAEEAAITIHTVGLGSAEGTTLIDPATGAPRTTEDGTPVVSKLDEESLRSLAKRGGGVYTPMQSVDAASRRLAAAIAQTKGAARKDGGEIEADHLYYFALLPAFLLLLWQMAQPLKRRPHAAVACLLALLPSISVAQNRQLRKGNEHYRAGRYQEANDAYHCVLAVDSANAKGRFNQGAAQYQQKKFDAARSSLSAAAALSAMVPHAARRSTMSATHTVLSRNGRRPPTRTERLCARGLRTAMHSTIFRTRCRSCVRSKNSRKSRSKNRSRINRSRRIHNSNRRSRSRKKKKNRHPARCRRKGPSGF